MLLYQQPMKVEDPTLSILLKKEAIAKRYGWTFEEVDKLDALELAVIEGVIAGENRYQKFEEAKMKARK